MDDKSPPDAAEKSGGGYEQADRCQNVPRSMDRLVGEQVDHAGAE